MPPGTSFIIPDIVPRYERTMLGCYRDLVALCAAIRTSLEGVAQSEACLVCWLGLRCLRLAACGLQILALYGRQVIT